MRRSHLAFAWGHPGLALVHAFECGLITVLKGHRIDLSHSHVGFTGDALTVGAIGETRKRATAEEIENYIEARIPST